jgi:hypothetical protein
LTVTFAHYKCPGRSINSKLAELIPLGLLHWGGDYTHKNEIISETENVQRKFYLLKIKEKICHLSQILYKYTGKNVSMPYI